MTLDELLRGLRACIVNGDDEDAQENIFDLLRGLRCKDTPDVELTKVGLGLKELWKREQPTVAIQDESMGTAPIDEAQAAGQYRKKPVVIEAFLWDGKSIEELDTFMGEQKHDYTTEPKGRNGGYLVNIKTLEGVMTANIGDYIIKGVQGEFYPCKPDIFQATYEEVE